MIVLQWSHINYANLAPVGISQPYISSNLSSFESNVSIDKDRQKSSKCGCPFKLANKDTLDQNQLFNDCCIPVGRKPNIVVTRQFFREEDAKVSSRNPMCY